MSGRDALRIGALTPNQQHYPVMPPIPSGQNERTIRLLESDFYTGGEFVIHAVRGLGPETLRTAVGVVTHAWLLKKRKARDAILLPNGSQIVVPVADFNRMIGRDAFNQPARDLTERGLRELHFLCMDFRAEIKPTRSARRKVGHLSLSHEQRFLQSIGRVEQRGDLGGQEGIDLSNLPSSKSGERQHLLIFEPSSWLWEMVGSGHLGFVDLDTLRHLKGGLALTMLPWLHGRIYTASRHKPAYPWTEQRLSRLKHLFPLGGEEERWPSRYRRRVDAALAEIDRHSELLSRSSVRSRPWAWAGEGWSALLRIHFNSESHWWRKPAPLPDYVPSPLTGGAR